MEDATQDAVAQEPAAPAFDVDALAGQVADRLRESFQREPVRAYQPPAPAATPASSGDPVRDLVDPYVQPHVERAMRAAALAEEAATDAVNFYAAHPDLDATERKVIEERFQALKAKGVGFKREDLYNHYVGENLDKVIEKRTKSREDAAKRAANAGAVVGAGSPDKAPQLRDARSMPTDELEKALDGVLF